MSGRPLSAAECERLWAGWTPAEIADRLSGVSAPWCVTAGWALDLFVGGLGRAHGDLEISVPRARFDEIIAALPGYEWDVVGDGHVWPFPEEVDTHHQTWLREPSTGRYHLDVFREPHRDEQWICRRDPAITVPHHELILHTADGIPFAIPEVVLLFKAKALRAKDESDFQRALPTLDHPRKSRLADWLARVHPNHPWIDRLT